MGDGGLVVTQSSGTGARLHTNYHDTKHDVVPVPVMDIRDATSSAKEEVFQFGLGGFLSSGSFWLGFERLLTVGWNDALFLSCIAFLVAGAVMMVIGYRQTIRRISRLERYLPEEES